MGLETENKNEKKGIKQTSLPNSFLVY